MNILVCMKQILDPEIPARDFRVDALFLCLKAFNRSLKNFIRGRRHVGRIFLMDSSCHGDSDYTGFAMAQMRARIRQVVHARRPSSRATHRTCDLLQIAKTVLIATVLIKSVHSVLSKHSLLSRIEIVR